MARPIKSTDPVLDQRLDELLKDYKTPETLTELNSIFLRCMS
jgi:hypothetical protein